ncbi:hypothetical protein L914_01505 [Phytophthora nicotianae]|uniref:Uncharacterized protein n=1 Tax=Phytophthora nicotianae TaxID=4792 RepID=W2P3K9_PHYNI|nr:hypothetical protein L914_01505 [Phytophthora nicotianae]
MDKILKRIKDGEMFRDTHTSVENNFTSSDAVIFFSDRLQIQSGVKVSLVRNYHHQSIVLPSTGDT